MGMHKHYFEYTEEELKAIKQDVCVKHKCPYLSSYSSCNQFNGKGSVVVKCCNYILYTGKMRGCMPDDCTFYKDKNVKKRRFGFTTNNFDSEIEGSY